MNPSAESFIVHDFLNLIDKRIRLFQPLMRRHYTIFINHKNHTLVFLQIKFNRSAECFGRIIFPFNLFGYLAFAQRTNGNIRQTPIMDQFFSQILDSISVIIGF
ncbi:MAG TPA: hypothetical protein DCQ37_22440 [Desulfobacteraceae bacterium]|nr:hypothetical protein [Desulfobacteraceae bacterium]